MSRATFLVGDHGTINQIDLGSAGPIDPKIQLYHSRRGLERKDCSMRGVYLSMQFISRNGSIGKAKFYFCRLQLLI